MSSPTLERLDRPNRPTQVLDRAVRDSLVTLDGIPDRRPYVIHDVLYPEGVAPSAQRLEELGFLPGERVEVLTRGRPGGDPLAIRVGHSTFALRRAEAACVRVRPWPAESPSHE